VTEPLVIRGELGTLAHGHQVAHDRKSPTYPNHVHMVVFGRMFFDIQLHYKSLPNPLELTTDQIVAYYRQLHPYLLRVTASKDG